MRVARKNNSIGGTCVQGWKLSYMKNDPSSMQCRDSDSRPLDIQSPNITTRPLHHQTSCPKPFLT